MSIDIAELASNVRELEAKIRIVVGERNTLQESLKQSVANCKKLETTKADLLVKIDELRDRISRLTRDYDRQLALLQDSLNERSAQLIDAERRATSVVTSHDIECEITDSQQNVIGELLGALKHTLKVYHSMADRGNYPLELLDYDDANKLSKHFLGKRGFQYLIDAIKTAEPKFDSFKFSQECING